MSIPQTNFENNNRMSELIKNINDIFGYILLYSVIIFTALSVLFGGIVVYPIYGAIYIFNKIRTECCKSASAQEIAAEIASEVEEPEKKPIIDENWCNISVKNIINYQSEAVVQNEIEDISNAEGEVEEVLSIRRPSEEELKQFQEEEKDESASEADASEYDYSPKDKYSIGHYKSKTHINDPLDFDN
jgi:hypothetical protein